MGKRREDPVDDKFMKEALDLAAIAGKNGDIPIGAVVVKDGRVIGRGYNKKEVAKDATMHGEMIALREAAKTLGHWWLEDCTMYVTLEPCSMCAGAMVNARLSKVVIGAKNPRFGACGSAINIPDGPSSNHKMEIVFGVMEEEGRKLLQEFFKNLRK